MSHLENGGLVKGLTFIKWNFANGGEIKKQCPFEKFGKRKIKNEEETYSLVKRLKLGDTGKFEKDMFGVHVTSRINNLKSDYSRRFARWNIHNVLLEAEMYSKEFLPSAPPLPLENEFFSTDSSDSDCSQKTFSTVPADELYHPRLKNEFSVSLVNNESCKKESSCVSIKNNNKDSPLFTCVVS